MGLLTTRPLSTDKPSTDPGWLLRAGVAAVTAAVVISVAWVEAADRREAVVLAMVMSVALLASMLLPWRRWPERWQVLPALAGFAPVAAFDYAAGMYYLAVAPVIWIMLFFSRRVLLVALGAFLVTLFLPRLVAPAAYPVPDLATLLLVSLLLVIAALAGQHLAYSARTAVAEAKDSAIRARNDRDMLNAYLDNAGALVVVLDPTGKVLLFNRFMEDATGVSTADVVGHYTWDPNDAEDAARRSFERVIAGESPVTVESDLTTIHGDVRRVAWTTTTVRDEQGRINRVVSIGLDVTAQREAETATLEALARERQAADRLRQLDRAKSDFVATVSHDLRTPLTSIVGNTELLIDGDAGDLTPIQHRLLTTVRRNAERLDTLVGDLLLLSRLESGTMELNLRPITLAEIIEGSLEALASKLSADVDLAVDAPADPVMLEGDRDQLERVVINLLGNAIKFTPPGGRIGLAVAAAPEQVQVQVWDTGIGIPEEELPYVFDRFYRSSRTQGTKSPGTGLGLTIAKSIIEMHGGSIRAGSNPEGGTVFTVTLPRIPANADERAQEYA